MSAFMSDVKLFSDIKDVFMSISRFTSTDWYAGANGYELCLACFRSAMATIWSCFQARSKASLIAILEDLKPVQTLPEALRRSGKLLIGQEIAIVSVSIAMIFG